MGEGGSRCRREVGGGRQSEEGATSPEYCGGGGRLACAGSGGRWEPSQFPFYLDVLFSFSSNILSLLIGLTSGSPLDI